MGWCTRARAMGSLGAFRGTCCWRFRSMENERREMNLDELRDRAGQEIGVSGWRTVTAEQIERFAEVTGDDQWIHVDVERARRESPYGTTIAHGFLTVSLVSRLMREAVEIAGDFKMRINY